MYLSKNDINLITRWLVKRIQDVANGKLTENITEAKLLPDEESIFMYDISLPAKRNRLTFLIKL